MPRTPFVLGRKVHHDPRNAQVRYAVPELPRRAIKSVDWQRRVPVFDQGQVGSCTFNAGAGCYATDGRDRAGQTVAVVKADSKKVFTAGSYAVQEDPFVLKGYSLTTKLDSFPGDYPKTDTGSDGPSVGKAMVQLGLATKYTHAFSIGAVQTALQLGAVMWGTLWLNSMFDLDAHDYLVVDKSSGEAGGHEIAISGYDTTTDIYKVQNSWSEDWGDRGFFYVRGPDLKWLLAQQGDATQPVWTEAPAPPPPPAPSVDDAALWAAARTWAAAKGLS